MSIVRSITSKIFKPAFLGLLAVNVLLPSGVFAQAKVQEALTIFAAASLNEAFLAIGREFEAIHPGERVTFNFAGSQQLVQQLANGAPADVFASADLKQMTEAAASGRIESNEISVFAHNRLVVVLPRDNKAGIHRLADLAHPHLKIILADRAVPAGRYALEFLMKCNHNAEFDTLFASNVLANVVSYEENVRSVLSKIILGEADAGVVYTSDVPLNNRKAVVTLDIPEKLNIFATYPIAVVKDAGSRSRAEEFVGYVLSGRGQSVLAQYGFISTTGIPAKK